MLTTAGFLCHFRQELEQRLAADASSYSLGCVLSHVFPDGSERPIAYASRSLTLAERKYSQIEREALAIVFGVSKFRMYLWGRHFQLFTDHQPLLMLFGNKKPIPEVASSRVQRWALALSAYNFSIHYKSGKKHANADMLSRLPCSEQLTAESEYIVCFMDELPISAKTVRYETKKDSVLIKIMYYVINGWPHKVTDNLEPYYRCRDELSIEQECLIRGSRVVIPTNLQRQILNQLHIDHIGIVKTKGLARSYVWWPGLDKNIEEMIKTCHVCQINQNLPAEAPLFPWPLAKSP